MNIFYPDVQLSGKEPFRNPHRVEEGSRDVERPHEDEPADGHLLQALLPPVDDPVVRGRSNPAQPEEYENA